MVAKYCVRKNNVALKFTRLNCTFVVAHAAAYIVEL